MRRLAAVLLACALASSAALLAPSWSAASSRPHLGRPWTPVKGIAVNVSLASTISDHQAMGIGTQLFSMLATTFHANAVSLNFPFYQSGSRADNPQRAAMTPSPGRLLLLTELAHRFGLSVQYRPYLWEGNLVNESRPSIDPVNVAVWFQNYWTFLEPYLESANEAGAASFSVALEFTTLLPHLSDWERIVQKAKTVYAGELFYSQQHVPQETIPFTERGYDAYQPIPLKSDRLVSIAAFTAGFIKNFRMVGMQSTPGDLTAEEVGIPAVSHAYLRPNFFHYLPGTKVVRVVQADWFAGACNAFRKLHLAGIYYWSIDFNTFTPSENAAKMPGPSRLYNWLATPSAAAIQSCFARTP
jgi:Glycoside Hydrolase Family 113